MIALDDALKLLAEVDPRKAQVIELRFFGGLTAEETAEVLRVSPTPCCGTGNWRAPGCSRSWKEGSKRRPALTASYGGAFRGVFTLPNNEYDS